jgi:phospholipase/carboxylesterase
MSEIPLDYVHHEPDGDSDEAVFILHGRGADEQDLLPVADQLPGDRHVISFRAPDRLRGGYTWYQLDLSAGGLENSQPHAEEFRRSLDLVAESVDAAVEEFGLDADKLGLLGFSQGAITSLSSVLESPDRFAWVVALHGYLAEEHEETTPAGIEGKPVFVGAGKQDQIIPAHRSEAAAERFHDIGADVRYEAFNTGHGIGQGELEAVVEFVEEHA